FLHCTTPSLFASLSYTTLFRSARGGELLRERAADALCPACHDDRLALDLHRPALTPLGSGRPRPGGLGVRTDTRRCALCRAPRRSEEHTSELQSPDHLVSRLLT